MVVSPLATAARQAVQHGRLGLFKSGSAMTRFGGFFFGGFVSGIGDGSFSVADSFTDLRPWRRYPRRIAHCRRISSLLWSKNDSTDLRIVLWT